MFNYGLQISIRDKELVQQNFSPTYGPCGDVVGFWVAFLARILQGQF